jgi:hypothetical protein
MSAAVRRARPFLASFDAASGKLLMKTMTNGPIGGGIGTYRVGTKQYVAVAAGMKNGIMKTESGPAAVVIHSMGSQRASAAAH